MNIIKRIRKSYITKGLAAYVAISMLTEIIAPTVSMALTSGPSQPEVQSFEPVETTDMVNLFTGDFTYNIPLMSVPGPNGGYPINLAYHAGVSMDQEASWVGLGWNINAGAINRNVRGVPDDFAGDPVKVTQDIKNSWTIGLGVSGSAEVFGADFSEGFDVTLGLNFRYNNYKGFGYSLDAGMEFGEDSPTYNTGLSIDSEDGIGVYASATLSKELNERTKGFYNTSLNLNSRNGLGMSTGISYLRIKRKIITTTDVSDYSKLKKETYQEIDYNFDASKSEFDNALEHDLKIGGLKIKSINRVKLIEITGYAGSSSSISFAFGNHSPVSPMPMNNYRLNVSIGAGASVLGVFPKAKFSGNFDTQTLKHKGKEIVNKTYGYENMSEDAEYLDFSRTKDGNVMKTSSNLATPQITHDYYGIQGQGIGGSFRAYRNETGRVYDPTTRSYTAGAYFNLDAGGNKAGWGGGATVGNTYSGRWNNNNSEVSLAYSSTGDLWKEQGSGTRLNEKVYYKNSGDKSPLNDEELTYIGGDGPIAADISGNGFTGNFKADIFGANIVSDRNVEDRIPRNNLVHKLTNEEVFAFHPDDETLPRTYASNDVDYVHEYEIFYYDWSGFNGNTTKSEPTTYLNRKTKTVNGEDFDILSHNAGFKVLDESGSYYVYGLPVYNNNKTESVFSINALEDSETAGTSIYDAKDNIIPLPLENGELNYKHTNTNKYLNKRETPPYSTSYLLTSILGADYVDVDDNGPSDNDKGYWVKMDYVKYASNYKWRAPYSGCLYNPGKSSTLEDDVASYSYGEKELWYLTRIETSTHIAIFTLSERNDNFEVDEELNQLSNNHADERGTKSGLKIDKISLYKKSDYLNEANPIPIQEIHFEYDYSLCQGVPNNDGGLQNNDSATQNQGGKLTLKRVWFTVEGNNKGTLNPYIFNYDDNSNFDYSTINYDRWGNHKPAYDIGDDSKMKEFNQQLTYVNQYHQGYMNAPVLNGTEIIEDELNKTSFQEEADQNVSAWSLNNIILPSGGEINVEYEADDYAYVQSERATQMTNITSVNDNTAGHFMLYRTKQSDNDFINDPTQRRIYFKLENPIPVASQSNQELADKVYADYVRDLIKDEGGNRNLYFRSYMALKDVAHDYVSGYVPLEENTIQNGVHTYGASSPQLVDGISCYTRGFVTLQRTKKKNGEYFNYHPMALLAWQSIRANYAEIMTDMGSFTDAEMESANTNKKKAKKVKNLFGFIPELTKIFTGYRRYCFNQGMAKEIDQFKSVIRLTTPDKKKYGGGLRVKKLALQDNWENLSGESTEEYGQVYDYTTTEIINGETITYSSGVAQYEPFIGGDENALRYPRYYPGKVPFQSQNNLFFEHPINESYMPAPIVGYSKVKVTTLNTNEILQSSEATLYDENTSFYAGRGVSDVKEYEFYTAKDFPVIVDQTEINKKSVRVPILIPFVGTYKRNKLAASQGYKIELNDMHGKLKSMAVFGLDENYRVNVTPLTKSTYLYNSKTEIYHDNVINRLVNKVTTMSVDPVTKKYIEDEKYVGMDYEFFTDQRHSKNHLSTLGFNFNVDVVVTGILAFIPSWWGTVNNTKNDVRLFVTNKIIHKSGLVAKIENKNESFVSVTENVLYDDATGIPVLSKTNNEFGDPIFNLTHPAHYEYDGMGQAYKNINLEFQATLSVASISNKLFTGTVPTEALDELVPGDVLIATTGDGTTNNPFKKYKATFLSKDYTNSPATGGVFYMQNFDKQQGQNWNQEITAYFKVYRSGRRNHYSANAGSLTKIGSLNYLGNNPTVETIDRGYGNEAIYINNFDKVLSISAATYKDNWENEVAENGIAIHENPYATGELGIWRAHKQYAYVGKREQDKTNGIKTYEDGVMNNVPQFRWNVSDFDTYKTDWIWGSEVTRYNKFGYQIENVDKLGIYSAALFGYNHAFVIGLGANAQYEELGVEDFERFTADNLTDDIQYEMDKESNLNFYEHYESEVTTNPIYSHDQFKILYGNVPQSGNAYVIIDVPYNSNYWTNMANTYVNFELNLTNVGEKLRYKLFKPDIISVQTYNSGNSTKITFDLSPTTTNVSIKYLPSDVDLAGRVIVYKDKSATSYDNAVKFSIVDTEAHTGRQSGHVNMGETATFRHDRMELVGGKDYTLSTWIKRTDENVPFYSEFEIKVEGENTPGTISFSDLQTGIRKGKIVNGWQKIEIDFQATYTGQVIRTSFADQKTSGDGLYIDDVRISPKRGGMVSYVYDPVKLRLVATLNANNYATYYFYNESGNLYLTKQETEEGIFTISESHGYLKSNIPNE